MDQLEFEKKAMEILLEGDDPTLLALRNQNINSKVLSREFTGHGFFTDYDVGKATLPVAGEKDFEIGDVGVTLNGEEDAIGMTLFIRKGRLSLLEGYVFSLDFWPSDFSNISFHYLTNDGNRNFDELRTKWA